jgi:2-hydroxy-6-oxonona-2,4-dienedioate hydrolase
MVVKIISRGNRRTVRERTARRALAALGLLAACGPGWLVAGPAVAQPAPVAPNGAIAGLEPRFVDVDGVRTRYYDYGTGEPMVLVHGGGRGTTSSANNWSRNIRGLADRFRVLAVDKSAAGMTGNPLDDADLSPAGEVRHMIRFIETMRVGPVHLVGHSSGGALVFYLAVERPDLISTLTVVSHGPGMPSDGRQTRLEALQDAHCAPQSTYEGRQCRLRLLAHSPHTFDQEFLAADAWMADQPKSREARAKYAAMDSARRAAVQEDTRRRAWERARNGALQMPMLIFAAKQDTLSWYADEPHAMMRGELAFFDIVGAKNREVKMVLINDGGHFPYREHPEVFNAELTAFTRYWSSRR